ncbi:hypothetical protein DAEQUDRAFT_404342 [Daedalea quercina L-15889]|uniref:Uncharacterized protein n=1 Tax=Daedalea quercina L-15889 TaxID=1314783 RepID=A0A165NS57_9APHY|nr:hypothetical protein DAEQUDRAFT_404342 [Daedalea quercina L-15889]
MLEGKRPRSSSYSISSPCPIAYTFGLGFALAQGVTLHITHHLDCQGSILSHRPSFLFLHEMQSHLPSRLRCPHHPSHQVPLLTRKHRLQWPRCLQKRADVGKGCL